MLMKSSQLLMMNYIAVAWNNFFIFAVWSEGGFQMSPVFPQDAWFPRLTDYASKYPFLAGLTTHFGFIISLAGSGCGMVYLLPQPLGL